MRQSRIELNMNRVVRPFTAIELFSGAGGLTVGLKRTGFRVVAAVEVDRDCANTYRANHSEVNLLVKDVRKVTGKELLRHGKISGPDLVAGCPPCQGFSSLTHKYTRPDPRNDLLLEMARLVLELKPRICMMENVPGLAQRGKALLDQFVTQLETDGYVVKWQVLQLADYGVPQWRRRLVLLAGKGFEVAFPKPTHSQNPGSKKQRPWITLRDALPRLTRPITLSVAHEKGGPKAAKWHVTRDMQPQTLRRLQASVPGRPRFDFPLELRPKCHKGDKGFSNVYGRMMWEQIAPTITGGCTTFCKGRFGHPFEDRTLSVREAAVLQTFPLSYEFETQFMDKVCEMIGNALPCRFAQKVSSACMRALIAQDSHRSKVVNQR